MCFLRIGDRQQILHKIYYGRHGNDDSGRLLGPKPDGLQRTCAVQDPSEHVVQFGRGRFLGGLEVTADVVDCAGQDVERIVEVVEFAACEDELVFRQLQVSGSLSSDPIPLSACLRAEFPRSSGAACWGDGATTPATPWCLLGRVEARQRFLFRCVAPLLPYGRVFRHDEIMNDSASSCENAVHDSAHAFLCQ